MNAPTVEKIARDIMRYFPGCTEAMALPLAQLLTGRYAPVLEGLEREKAELRTVHIDALGLIESALWKEVKESRERADEYQAAWQKEEKRHNEAMREADALRAEVVALRKVIENHECPLGKGVVWCSKHGVYHPESLDAALARPAREGPR